MADTGASLTKKIVLGVLVVICIVLVYRNVIGPAKRSTSEAVPSARVGSSSSPLRQRQVARRMSGDPSRRDRSMGQEELAALDPTLRVDLLKTVKYEGASRNIFQFYIPPPPKPVVSPIVAAAPMAPTAPAPPPLPVIPLKFYGMSTRPGAPEKKAFLTDGEQIFIGQEGEIIAKHYKIIRIGVSSLDWEDVQNHQSGQLPILQE